MVRSSPLLNCPECKPAAKPLNRRLRHTVTIEQKSTGRDSYGQPTTTWTTFATVRAAVEPLRGREFFSADQFNSEVTARIRIRYLSGVTAAMRVSFESRLYNIKAIIDPEEKHDELQLMCGEGVNDG